MIFKSVKPTSVTFHMLLHFRTVPLKLDMNPVAMKLDQDGQIAIQEGQTSDILENNFTLYDSKNHISAAHEEKKPQNESMERLFKCSICEDQFAKIEELTQHISSVHKEKNPIDWMVMPPKGQLILKCLFGVFK